jgi:peptide/nickel transport system substrate-binding protein
LLTELSAAPSTEERQAIWAELQELIYTDVPFLKFGTTRPLLGVSDDLVIEDPNGLMFAVYYNVAVTSEA